MTTLSYTYNMPADRDALPRVGEHPQRQPGIGASSHEVTIALVTRARTGDAEALNALCARFLPRMQRWAHGRLPNYARSLVDTHDLVQDTLAQVVRRLESFVPRHDGAFQGYVRQALHNRIRDVIRSTRGKFPEAIDSARPSLDPSPLEQAVGSELLESYEAALQRLKPEDREAIVARVEMGLTWAEVAKELEKNSPESAQMAVRRALVRLAREMSHDRA